jgi:hypothetical protein
MTEAVMTMFWEEVIAAYNSVSARHERRAVIESENKSAFVSYDSDIKAVVIKVKDVANTASKRTLIAP